MKIYSNAITHYSKILSRFDVKKAFMAGMNNLGFLGFIKSKKSIINLNDIACTFLLYITLQHNPKF